MLMRMRQNRNSVFFFIFETQKRAVAGIEVESEVFVILEREGAHSL